MSDEPTSLPQTPTGGSVLPPVDGRAAATQIARSLRSLRQAIRVHLVWTRTGLIVAALALFVVLAALLDYALGLPTGVRVLLWLCGAGWLAFALKKWLVPAAKFTTPLSVLALRVEESEQGKRAGWKHRIAAALELGEQEGVSSGSPTLRAAALQDLAGSLAKSKIHISGLIERKTALQAAAALAAALVCVLGLYRASPSLSQIGLARALTPWRDVQWPKATAIALSPGAPAHARGTPLPIRALLLRSAKPAARERITADIRVTIDDTLASEQRVVLSHQATRDSVQIAGTSVQGDVFERLLDTAPLIPANTPASSRVVVEVIARSSDDQTMPMRVRLVEPPRILSMNANVSPPEYIAPLLAARNRNDTTIDNLSRVLLAGESSLVSRDVETARTGGPAQASLGPVLAGSRVVLVVGFDQAMPAGDIAAFAPGVAQLPDSVRPTMSVQGDTWTFEWTATASFRTALLPVGTDGIAARDEAGLRVEVVEDLSPTAAVALPTSDESVLATAKIPVKLSARDDVAIALLQAFVQPAATAGQHTSAPQRTLLGEASASDVLASALTVDGLVDLTELRAKPGDEWWVLGAAQDRKGAVAQTAMVESSIRRLTIITESELVSQVTGEMAGLRDAASRLEQEQARLSQLREQASQQMQQGENEAAASALSQQATAQGAVAQRAQSLSQRLEKISARLERNQLDDEALKGLVQDADETAQAASEAAQRAQQALRTMSEQPRDEGTREQAQQAAREQQAQSQQELADLANMLDTKQDDWSVKRELERILTEQRQLRSQTQTAGSRTQGQESNELSREDRDDLERIARRQQELSQRTRESLQALDARAEQLKEQSPEQSQTMQEAAKQAREGQASNLQEQAAKQVRENRTGQAQQAQANAEKALEQALKKLDDVQQARDEQLRRTLADLMQSLDALIAAQEGAIAQLAPVLAGDAGIPATQLAQTMIALQRNTLGTMTRLKADDRQARALEAVLDNLQAASDAQATAIVVLRAPEADLAEADKQERTSLQSLNDAKAEAEKLQEDSEEREQQRKREELREKYQQMLEQHLQVQTATKELVGQEQSRRTRAAARQMSQQQKLVREGLAQIRSDTAELAEAKIFDFAHTRLEQLLTRAGAELEQGNVTTAVASDQSTVTAILSSLVEALKSNRDKKDDLQDGGGGGGGGEGGQQGGQPPPLVPPLAELILLRGMQAEAAARTAAQGAVAEQAGADAGALKAEIAQTAELQQQLADLAQQLLDALQEQQNQEQTPPLDKGEAAPADTSPDDAGEEKESEKP